MVPRVKIIMMFLLNFLGLRFTKRDWCDERDAQIAKIVAPRLDKVDVEGRAGPASRRVEAERRAEVDCH